MNNETKRAEAPDDLNVDASDLNDEICVCGHEKRLHGVDGPLKDRAECGAEIIIGYLEGNGFSCGCMKFQPA